METCNDVLPASSCILSVVRADERWSDAIEHAKGNGRLSIAGSGVKARIRKDQSGVGVWSSDESGWLPKIQYGRFLRLAPSSAAC
jgi:hypothetical protein